MTCKADIQESIVDCSGSEQFLWRAHPARERVTHALAAGTVVLGIAAAVYVSFASMTAAIGSLIVLVAALNRFFFPSTFSVDESGITARYPLRSQHEQWRDLRRFVHDAHGGFLSRRSGPSRLDGYRGMHLLFGADREAAVACIERLMAESRRQREVNA